MIQESIENYLEHIYMLSREQETVRAIDLARALDYSKPTISVVIKKLRAGHYVTVDPEGPIHLTDTGLEIARRTYERHQILSRMLMTLGVDEETALADACKIEHDISEQTFECIKRHLQVHNPLQNTEKAET